MNKYYLLITLLILCTSAKAQYLNHQFQGKSQLENPEYILQINQDCLYSTANETEEDIKKCPFHQLGYIDNDSNHILFPMGEKIDIADFGDGNKLFVVRGSDLLSYGYQSRLDLYMENSGSFIPSKILIYGLTEQASRDRHQELFYYLNGDFLYLLQFEIGEEGYKGDFWKKYFINFKKGSFDLMQSIECVDKKDSSGDVIFTERESTIRECNFTGS